MDPYNIYPRLRRFLRSLNGMSDADFERRRTRVRTRILALVLLP